MTPAETYSRLGRLIETMPFLRAAEIPSEMYKWLGDVYALVSVLGDSSIKIDLKMAIDNLTKHAGQGGFSLQAHNQAAQEIPAILYRALAVAELKAPVSDRGGFIPAGNAFDALSALTKVLSGATDKVIIVDPYLDEKVLLEFATVIPERVTLQLLADEKDYKPSLLVAGKRWKEQYGINRPLEIRLSAPRTLHDRLIIVDDSKVWVLTQSLNAFATRSPATIVHYPDETKLKINSYADIWKIAIAV